MSGLSKAQREQATGFFTVIELKDVLYLDPNKRKVGRGLLSSVPYPVAYERELSRAATLLESSREAHVEPVAARLPAPPRESVL